MEILAKVYSNRDGKCTFVCVFCVLSCVCVVLFVQNLNYSLTTFVFVLPLYSYSGQITPVNVLPINQSCIKNG